MKVKDLIEALRAEGVDPEALVVMSCDAEGNCYSPVGEANVFMRYWDGEIGLKELTEDLRNKGYSDEDVLEDGEDCVVIWPR